MDPVAPRGEAAELARFRRLLTVTIVATFALIVIGGIVRVSDSGLGCGPAGSGTHGWPLCEGGLLPAGSAESAIEFSHRLAAGVVAILIAVCAWQALRRFRGRRVLVRGSVAAAVLVLVQAGLGGLTVDRGLDEELVAAHLGLAMVLLALLLFLRRAASPAPAPPAERTRGLRPLAALAATLVLATIVAGGYVAGTEKEGTPGEPVRGQAHVACGEQFPGCNGKFMPFGQSRLVDIHLTHRLFMYLASLGVLAMAALATARRGLSPAFAIAGVLLVCQVMLGAANVWAGKHAGLILGHLTLGTLLWGTVVYAGATLLPAAVPAGSRLQSRDAASAVTA